MIWSESYDTFIANTPNVKTTTRFASRKNDSSRRVIDKKSFRH